MAHGLIPSESFPVSALPRSIHVNLAMPTTSTCTVIIHPPVSFRVCSIRIWGDVLRFEGDAHVEQKGVGDADNEDVSALNVRGALPRHDDRGALVVAGRASPRTLLSHPHRKVTH